MTFSRGEGRRTVFARVADGAKRARGLLEALVAHLDKSK